MKIKSIIGGCTIILLLSVVFFSCGNIWQVQGGADITMQIDLQELAGTKASDLEVSRSIQYSSDGAIPSPIDDETDGSVFPFIEGDRITVTLYNANSPSQSQIASRSIFIEESAHSLNTSVTFGKIPLNTKLYATIVIERNQSNTWLRVFESRSETLTVSGKQLEVPTYPNVAFLSYIPGANPNITKNAGLTSSNPASTFEDAINILKKTGSFLPGATIYVTNSIVLEDDSNDLGIDAPDGGRLVDLQGLTIRRLEPNYSIFTVKNGKNLTIQGGILEGDDFSSAPLVTVEGDNSSVLLTGGVVLQNNYATGVSAGVDVRSSAKLIMNNATIRNNLVYTPADTAGVSLEDDTILELAGGSITIAGNTNHDRMDSNVRFYPGLEVGNVDTFPVQVTNTLHASSSIGLSINTSAESVVVVGNGAKANINNFFSDERRPIEYDVDGNIVLKDFKRLYIGGATASDANSGLTLQDPIKSFPKAVEILNGQPGFVYIAGTITVTGKETWALDENQNVYFDYDHEYLGEDAPISADFIMVDVKEGAHLTMENIRLGGGTTYNDATIKVQGLLALKGNIEIHDNPASERDNKFVMGAIELIDNGKLEIYSGHIHLNNGIRYTLPENGESSPISIKGVLDEESIINLYFFSKPMLGDILVEKGSNSAINTDIFTLYVYGSGRQGFELDKNGNLVYLELKDEVYIDGVNGVDTNYGGITDPVKSFERASLLSASDATIKVSNTITIKGTESWDYGKELTILRGEDFADSLINVPSGATLLFPWNGSDIIIDGNSTNIEATAPLITINKGGEAIFEEDHGAILQNNKNNNGAGAILVNGGRLTIKEEGVYLSKYLITNNTSADGFAAVTIQNNAYTVLDGATIISNTGGGVHVSSNSILILKGNTIVQTNLTSGGVRKNISFEESQNAQSHGIFLGGQLTQSDSNIIGITLPPALPAGTVVIKNLIGSGYLMSQDDANKFFRDDGENNFNYIAEDGELSI